MFASYLKPISKLHHTGCSVTLLDQDLPDRSSDGLDEAVENSFGLKPILREPDIQKLFGNLQDSGMAEFWYG